MRILVTGISGMDGSLLAQQLVDAGHEVHGIIRRHAVPHFPNIAQLLEKDAIHLHEADLTDQNSLDAAIAAARPEEVYNLGAQSYVGVSYTEPEHTLEVTGLGAMRVFEAVRRHARNARVYQASSSEMFGNALAGLPRDAVLHEDSPMLPESPYGVAKLAAHNLARIYRKAYGMHISSGILFNHEHETRGVQFVTRKITMGLARIKHGKQRELHLGNVEAVRDWGYAPEYVQGMQAILRDDEPGDWVLATGEGHTVEDFLREAMRAAGLPWHGNPSFIVTGAGAQRRPTDIDRLVGSPGAVKEHLGWEAKTRFRELVQRMVKHDLDLVAKGGA